MGAVRTSNNKAREYVVSLTEFKGSNTFSELEIPNDYTSTYRYIVYSYGYHYPMFVAEWQEGGEPVWYENEDKYSRSTGKQRSQLHPLLPTTKLNTSKMRTLALLGISGVFRDWVNT